MQGSGLGGTGTKFPTARTEVANTLSTGAHVSRNRKSTLLHSQDLRVNSVSARVFVTAPRMLIEEEETNYWLGNSFVSNVASVHVQLEETKATLRAEIVASAI